MNKAIYYLLDVFTDRKFGGNQLAIFPDATILEEELLPKIAKELNLSETVYLFPKTGNTWPMRIFTPGKELPTAGHPTIGAAFYLSRETKHGMDNTMEVEFDQKIGKIKARVDFEDSLPQKATMQLPLPQFGKVYNNRKNFAELLSLDLDELADTPVQWISCGVPFIFIQAKTVESIRKAEFRLDLWKKLSPDLNGASVYTFAKGGEEKGSDVHGRMFAPDLGVAEDPATGSANGPLGCYCVNYGITSQKIISEQGYEMGRPSKIYIDISKDQNDDITTVEISGKCKFIGKGEIFLF